LGIEGKEEVGEFDGITEFSELTELGEGEEFWTGRHEIRKTGRRQEAVPNYQIFLINQIGGGCG
jgi:hypothetical protein